MTIRAVLDEYAHTLQRAFAADRSQTVGASEVGQCARKIFWAKNEGDPICGAQRDSDYTDTWGARVRGTVFEEQVWTPALRARFGDRLLLAGNEQRTLVAGFLSATPDALLIEQPPDALAHLGVLDIGGDAIVLECKTADPRRSSMPPSPSTAIK